MDSDLRSSKLHQQLAARLAREIVSGRVAPEEPLPSELALVAVRNVSKSVVRAAAQALVPDLERAAGTDRGSGPPRVYAPRTREQRTVEGRRR